MHIPHIDSTFILALALFAHAWVMRIDDHPNTAVSAAGWTVAIITFVVLMSQLFLR